LNVYFVLFFSFGKALKYCRYVIECRFLSENVNNDELMLFLVAFCGDCCAKIAQCCQFDPIQYNSIQHLMYYLRPNNNHDLEKEKSIICSCEIRNIEGYYLIYG